MIQFDRGPEPPLLAARRTSAFEEVLPIAALHGQKSKALRDKLGNYSQGKAELHERQNGKCAFCERFSGLDGNPLEHFRPKKGAIRQDGQVDEAHYWWLCWTWENHVFACNVCNGASRKGNKFWIAALPAALPVPAAAMTTLPADNFNVAAEGALLIDPATEDPLDHIRWAPLATAGPPRLWKWKVIGLTPKGVATIAILKLTENLETIQSHVANHLVSRVESVKKHLLAGRPLDAAAEWQLLLDDAVANAKAELRGPTWCALHGSCLIASAPRQGWRRQCVPRAPDIGLVK